MTDRNWDKELAKIDKQLASVSDEELVAQNAPQRAPLVVAAPAKGAAAPAKTAVPVVQAKTGGGWFAWVQLTLAIAAATGLWLWPWGTRCGLNAVAFTGATGVVTLLGLWSAVGSWRHRQAYAHVLSFAVMIWGLVLGAREVLPRMGYAIPTADRPGGWSCEAPTASPVLPPGGPAQAVPGIGQPASR